MPNLSIGHLERVRALAAQGALLAIGGVRAGASSAVTLYDADARKVLRQFELPTHVWALAMGDGQLFAGGADGRVYRVDVASGERRGDWVAHEGGVCALALEGDLLATAGVDGRARVWRDGVAAHEFGAAGPQRAVALDARENRLASAGDDGVVRVFGFGGDAAREMAGHRGAVRALAFTPRDGRLASAGDDGTVRFWYLEGAVECEVRGEGDTGHAGGAAAIAFLPTPAADADDPSDRLVSVGADAKLRTVRLDDKRREKTLDVATGPRCVVVLKTGAKGAYPIVVVAGDARTLSFIGLGDAGRVEGVIDVGLDAFAVWAMRIKMGQRGALQAMAKELPLVPEAEVVPLLEALRTAADRSTLPMLAQALAEHPRRDARHILRALVGGADEQAALVALAALAKAEPQPFDALRFGVRAKVSAVRIAALKALPAQYPAVPLVPAAIVGCLNDEQAAVRAAAVDALEAVFPEGVEALTMAFEKGPPDVRAEVLVRALMQGKLSRLQSLSGRALDDEAVLVRQVALTVRVLERPTAAARLETMLSLPEVLRRANGGAEPDAGRVKALRAKLGLDAPPKDLVQEDLTPLLVAMSARATDTASLGAAGLLFVAGDVRAVAALLLLSREEPAAHRVWVLKTLTQLADPRARQRVLAMVDDPDAQVRAAAVEAIEARKDEASKTEFASVLLRGAFEDVRRRGIGRLVRLSPAERTGEADALLQHAIDDEASAVRQVALKTLWAWLEATPEVAVDRLLAARFADLRLAAVRQLGLIARAPTSDDAPPPKTFPAWVAERLERAIGDRDGEVGEAAMTLLARLLGEQAARPMVAGLASTASVTRQAAARRALRLRGGAEAGALREPLVKALSDLEVPVRLTALESVDGLVSDEAGPLTAGLLSDALEVRVRAAELLALRGDERIIEPMRAFVLDEELRARHPAAFIEPLRARAVSALATLGSSRTAAIFATPLLADANPGVREQAARGLCNAGAQAQLLDALAHADVAVRSWAAEGLARLGDDRGLPVLTGTLRDEHLPIREGALRALAALGPACDNALFLGLDDADTYLSDTFVAVLLARDLRAARDGGDPELLTAALSARRPDVRFAAARALELRSDVTAYADLLLEAVSPARPEKAAEMKGWPAEAERERAASRLLQLLAAETPEARYLAGQALLLRRRPLDYFREVDRVVALRPASETVVPDTNQRGRAATDAVARGDWLRKLFAWAGFAENRESKAAPSAARWLAFGAYVGLVRLSDTDETARRVRRDSVQRMVAMAQAGSPRPASVVPPLVRALDDEDALVRQKAFAGLTALLADAPDEAIRFALASSSGDVGVRALDALMERGASARPWFVDALGSPVAEVRQHAFVLLERLDGAGSLDALMAALGSPHADLRLGVLKRLAASRDARVQPALRKALESDRADVRLLAAELLAQRKDDAAVPVLAGFLSPDAEELPRARAALAVSATDAAAAALSAHLRELAALPPAADPAPVLAMERATIEALAATRRPSVLAPLVERFEDVDAGVAAAAFRAALALTNHRRPPARGEPDKAWRDEERRHPRDGAGVLEAISAAAHTKDATLRLAAATEADVGAETAYDALLVSLFGDRDQAVRVQAVVSYAARVERHGAATEPLEQVVALGTRELLLPAAEGLAGRRRVVALRPLLLFARAGELPEQVRAVLALGALGEVRALAELETLAAGGTDEAPVAPDVRAAAIEALGRLWGALRDPEAKKRVHDTVETAALDGRHREAGIRGLRWLATDGAVARLQQLAAADDEAQHVRLTAVRELGVLGDTASEAVLAGLLSTSGLAAAALRALEACFPKEPLRVALQAASSELSEISGPALSFLLAEAEPGPLIERLAAPRLDELLRERVRLGLGRRGALPTEPLVKLVASEWAVASESGAWLMARLALGGVEVPAGEREARVRALVDAATATAKRWAKSVASDREAEAQALQRLFWAATLLEAKRMAPLAEAALREPASAPAEVRVQAVYALQALGGAAADGLALGARDVDASVRRAAVGALAVVAPARATQLVDALHPIDALAFEGLKPDVAMLSTAAGRLVALPGLIASGDSRALMKLAEAGGDVAAQRAALSALGRMGGDEVAAFLERLAFSAGHVAREDDDGDDDDDGGDEDEDDGDSGPSPDVSMPGARRFEYEDDGSSKFWEVLVTGDTCTVRFGKIGTAGQKKPKKLASPEAAEKEQAKLIREKTGKGYEEVEPRGVKPPRLVKPAAEVQAAKAPAGAAWGDEALRRLAYRAMRRAQRTNERRAATMAWFTPEQLEQLAADPALALEVPRAAPKAVDDDDGPDDEAFDDDDEGDSDDDE